jgi:hypothetical protein
LLDCNCCLLCSTLGARPLRVLVVGRTASGPSVTHRQGLTYTMPDPSTAGPLATARQSSDGRTGRHSAGRRRLMQSVGHTAPGLLGRLPGTPRPWPLQGGKARRAWGRGLPPPPPPPPPCGARGSGGGLRRRAPPPGGSPTPTPTAGRPTTIHHPRACYRHRGVAGMPKASRLEGCTLLAGGARDGGGPAAHAGGAAGRPGALRACIHGLTPPPRTTWDVWAGWWGGGMRGQAGAAGRGARGWVAGAAGRRRTRRRGGASALRAQPGRGTAMMGMAWLARAAGSAACVFVG